jgi:uncharacterized protein (TIGR02679 family)
MSDLALPGQLREYLAADSLRPLRERLRERLERNGLRPEGVVVVELDEDAALRIDGILGRTVHAGRARLDLAELDQALRASAAAAGLVVVLSVLDGPLIDRRGLRAARAQEQVGLWQQLDAALDGAGLSAAGWVPTFLDGVRRSGLLTRAGAAAAAAAIAQTGAALGVLAAGSAFSSGNSGAAAEPGWELAELAGQITGDAHGLDDGRLAASLVLRAAAATTGMAPPSTAAHRRAVWTSVGVSSDMVSGTVLAWQLRPAGAGRWAAMARERANIGLVTHLTLQELRAAPTELRCAGVVHACENPQVLQAAVRAGATGPLLCFAGNPSSAGLLLLERLTGSGTRVAYHGDFDWPGIAIAGRLMLRGAQPWRMGAADYEAALDTLQAEFRLELTGAPGTTPWDPELALSMRASGVAVHEESLLDVLLGDLS